MQRDIWKKEEEEGRKGGTGHRTAEKRELQQIFWD